MLFKLMWVDNLIADGADTGEKILSVIFVNGNKFFAGGKNRLFDRLFYWRCNCSETFEISETPRKKMG
jgi:hypothetical protein